VALLRNLEGETMTHETKINYKRALKQASMLQRFKSDERGSTIIMFAAALGLVLVSAGGAVDIGRRAMAKDELSSAIDAAALAACRSYQVNSAGANIEQIQRDEAVKYLAANFNWARYDIEPVAPTVTFPSEAAGTTSALNARQVIKTRISSTVTIPTKIMKIFGLPNLRITATSECTRAQGGIEVTMVLDTTGSMNESLNGAVKIVSLRAATVKFINLMFGGQETSDYIRVNILPYSQTVNVGKLMQPQDFQSNPQDPSVTRTSSGWLGCILERPTVGTIGFNADGTSVANLDDDMMAPDGALDLQDLPSNTTHPTTGASVPGWMPYLQGLNYNQTRQENAYLWGTKTVSVQVPKQVKTGTIIIGYQTVNTTTIIGYNTVQQQVNEPIYKIIGYTKKGQPKYGYVDNFVTKNVQVPIYATVQQPITEDQFTTVMETQTQQKTKWWLTDGNSSSNRITVDGSSYSGKTIPTKLDGASRGYCPGEALLWNGTQTRDKLENNSSQTRTSLINKIEDTNWLVPGGSTYSDVGMMWGVRIMSAGAPFPSAVLPEDFFSKDTANPYQGWVKAIVLMTDGVISAGYPVLYGYSTTNTADNAATNYTAYGLRSRGTTLYGSLRTLPDSLADNNELSSFVTAAESELTKAHEQRLLIACKAARRPAGWNRAEDAIRVYTVFFGSASEVGTKGQLYTDCAGRDGKFVNAQSESDLNKTFSNIASDLQNLRLSL
jgi:Flp pilus assembly protein TadG